MFGSKKTCGHKSSAPFKAACTKEAGHTGSHGARGLRWGADGRIAFSGARKDGRR